MASSCSTPVPTVGDSGLISGTAWRCMFEPIRLRSMRLRSTKGISEAVVPITCIELASI